MCGNIGLLFKIRFKFMEIASGAGCLILLFLIFCSESIETTQNIDKKMLKNLFVESRAIKPAKRVQKPVLSI